MSQNHQIAPYPSILAHLVLKWKGRPGWTMTIGQVDRDTDQDSGVVLSAGLTLSIVTLGYNSRHPDRGEYYSVVHYFPVPPATYDYRSWRRWLLEAVLKVEVHEACEFFSIDGEFPYAPSHGPGNDPYLIREIGTNEDQRTSFRGTVKV